MRTRTTLVPLVASLVPLALAASCKSSSGPPANGAAPRVFDDVPVSESVHLDHMSGPVDMVRDAHGMVHIYAASATDAFRVEGYQVARDRTVQLELIRRSAEGRMAEVFGDVSASLIDDDITMRTLGLNRVARLMYDALDPAGEAKAWLDAYADGVSQFNARVQTGEEEIPRAMLAFPKAALQPWTGVDVLAAGRLQSQNLAYSAPSEIDDTSFVQSARAAFGATSADPLVQKRAGLLVDVVRFQPNDATQVLPGYPSDAQSASRRAPTTPRATVTQRTVDAGLLRSASGWIASSQRVRSLFGRGHIGSNDWLVEPSRTATGHAMIANDPHLALSAPATFWAVHVNVAARDPAQGLSFAGMAFPGIPGVILGFDDHVAWGSTTAFYDVTDVYQETLTSDGAAVVFNGHDVPLQRVHEQIAIAGAAPLEYDVLVVPHHGPIVPIITADHRVTPPDPSKGALSVKWTGSEPTRDIETVVGLVRAKTIDDARAAVESFGVGAQNWVFADTNGDTGYSSHAIIPTRDKRAFTWDPKKFAGTLPCFVLPGDGSAEWTGALDSGFIPHAKNPAKGYLVTANNDQVGTIEDDDPSNDLLPNGAPFYLNAFYDNGGAFRAGRITHRLESAAGKLSLDDLASIQADAHSNVGALLAPRIVDAIARAEEERATPGAHPDLARVVADPRYAAAGMPALKDLLTRWGADADYDTPAGVSLDDGSLTTDAREAMASEATLVFNAWLVSMVHATFDDELAKIGVTATPGDIDLRQSLIYMMTAPDPSKLATYDAAAKGSALFDDMRSAAIESQDDRTIASLLDAIDLATTKLGADRAQWAWGKLHTLTFRSLVSLWGSLSIPASSDATFPLGFPRHGEDWTVDVAGYYYFQDPKDPAFTFAYTNGPVQRFVVDLDPAFGPTVRNVLPGGEVWNNTSAHFRDEAELWRKNQNHPVPVTRDAIVPGADEHVVYGP